MSRRTVILAFAAILVVCGPASAQILNTLRGWSDIDEGWSVVLEGMFSLTRGNYHHMDLSVTGVVQYLTERNRLRFMASESFYSIDDNKVSEDFTVHLRHNYRLTDVFATLLFVQHQYKPYHCLQSRSLLGGGIRADILRTDAWDVALGASTMAEWVAYTEGVPEEDQTNARGSFFLSLVWKPVDRFTVDLSGFYQPLLPDFNEPLLMSSFSVQTDITGGLSLITGLDIDYDDNPVEGVERTDIELKSGLRFRF